jgi:hypothetical protein
VDEFEEYVTARGASLLRFAFLLSGHHATAEDLTQTALADAFVHWRKVQARHIRTRMCGGSSSTPTRRIDDADRQPKYPRRTW